MLLKHKTENLSKACFLMFADKKKRKEEYLVEKVTELS